MWIEPVPGFRFDVPQEDVEPLGVNQKERTTCSFMVASPDSTTQYKVVFSNPGIVRSDGFGAPMWEVVEIRDAADSVLFRRIGCGPFTDVTSVTGALPILLYNDKEKMDESAASVTYRRLYERDLKGEDMFLYIPLGRKRFALLFSQNLYAGDSEASHATITVIEGARATSVFDAPLFSIGLSTRPCFSLVYTHNVDWIPNEYGNSQWPIPDISVGGLWHLFSEGGIIKFQKHNP